MSEDYEHTRDYSLKEFWTGAKGRPALPAEAVPASVPALLIKKQGDYPPFWRKDASFISVMEELMQLQRNMNRTSMIALVTGARSKYMRIW